MAKPGQLLGKTLDLPQKTTIFPTISFFPGWGGAVSVFKIKDVKGSKHRLSAWKTSGRSNCPDSGGGGAESGRRSGGAGAPGSRGGRGLRAAQPRDSFASWDTDACAPRSRRGGPGVGGGRCGGCGTETVEVPSSARLAQTAAHGLEWHPSSGQPERAFWNWLG